MPGAIGGRWQRHRASTPGASIAKRSIERTTQADNRLSEGNDSMKSGMFDSHCRVRTIAPIQVKIPRIVLPAGSVGFITGAWRYGECYVVRFDNSVEISMLARKFTLA